MGEHVEDQQHRREQVPPIEWPWKGKRRRVSPIPVDDPRDDHVGGQKGEDRVRSQQTKLAQDSTAKAFELPEQPSNSVTTLGQMDDDEAGEAKPDVGVDGVADVEELQCSERSGDRGQQANMDEQASPRAPAPPVSRWTFDRRDDSWHGQRPPSVVAGVNG